MLTINSFLVKSKHSKCLSYYVGTQIMNALKILVLDPSPNFYANLEVVRRACNLLPSNFQNRLMKTEDHEIGEAPLMEIPSHFPAVIAASNLLVYVKIFAKTNCLFESFCSNYLRYIIPGYTSPAYS